MFERINYILHNIPDFEILDFYIFMYGPCAKNCEIKDCINCKRQHIMKYFKMYVKLHRIKAELKEDMTLKAYICLSWFAYMDKKYEILEVRDKWK